VLLTAKRDQVEIVAKRLLEKEVLDRFVSRLSVRLYFTANLRLPPRCYRVSMVELLGKRPFDIQDDMVRLRLLRPFIRSFADASASPSSAGRLDGQEPAG
jgi:hypothetical protein